MLLRHLLSPQSSRDQMTQSEGFSSFLIPSSHASLYETDVCPKHSRFLTLIHVCYVRVRRLLPTCKLCKTDPRSQGGLAEEFVAIARRITQFIQYHKNSL